MKYRNANRILPSSLVLELQNYIQGEYVYIPRKAGTRRNWGELSGYRDEIQKRNREIIQKHQNGASLEELSDIFGLSVYAIRKIIYQK